MSLNISTDVEIEVPFHDADMMRIAWHGYYVKYLEIARCKLLDEIDYNYLEMERSGYSWPIIDLHIRYVKPAKFQQKIRVTATLAEWENRLRIKYIICDAVTGEKLTKASTDQVAVDIKSGEMLYASPAIVFEKLGISEG